MARAFRNFNWVSFFCSIIALLLVLLILLNGVNPSATIGIHFVSTDTTNLTVASKLSNSSWLIDLTSITGNDLVGEDANAENLGLSNTYSLNLLTACAQSSNSTSCGKPHVGFQFNPATDLKLDNTALQGSYSLAYSSQLDSYGKVSLFLGIAYIVSAALLALSTISIALSGCFPIARLFAHLVSALSSLLLLAASTAAIVTFIKVRDTFNYEFGIAGLQTKVGVAIYVISYLACLFSFLTAFTLWFQVQRHKKLARQFGQRQRDLKTMSPTAVVTGGIGNEMEEQRRPGMLQRVTTWGRHNYAVLEKQRAFRGKRHGGDDEDRKALVAPDPDLMAVSDPEAGSSDREPLVASDHGDYEHAPGGIAMLPLPLSNKKMQNMNTAYEPYSNPT